MTLKRKSHGIDETALRQVMASRRSSWHPFMHAHEAGIRLEHDGDRAELLIYDAIGFLGVTAERVVQELKAVNGEALTVRINSPGGDVFEGLAIYNALAGRQGETAVQVDGLAASAASIVAMAGERITMQAGSLMMVHHPWAVAIGNAADMRDMAEVLDKIGNGLIDIYAQRTGQSAKDIRGLLDAQTWMDADEAVELGFADDKAGADQAPADQKAAAWDLRVYGTPPSWVTERQTKQAQAITSLQGHKATATAGYHAITSSDATTVSGEGQFESLGSQKLTQDRIQRMHRRCALLERF